MYKKLFLFVLFVIALTALIAFSKDQKEMTGLVATETETGEIITQAKPVDCPSGLKSYQNDVYGFSICIPEDAEVLTQYEDENKAILDLVFVRKDDILKLEKFTEYPLNPYFAVIKSGVSAFALERLSRKTASDESSLKEVLPKQVPCPDKSLSCKDGEMLNVKLLEWEMVPAENLTFRYRDEVTAKKKWHDVGFVWTDSRATYQMESIVPSNPINEQALRAMAESFR